MNVSKIVHRSQVERWVKNASIIHYNKESDIAIEPLCVMLEFGEEMTVDLFIGFKKKTIWACQRELKVML